LLIDGEAGFGGRWLGACDIMRCNGDEPGQQGADCQRADDPASHVKPAFADGSIRRQFTFSSA
jgi:hypothetical protein